METLSVLLILFSLVMSVLLFIFVLTVPKHLADISRSLHLMYLLMLPDDEDDEDD